MKLDFKLASTIYTVIKVYVTGIYQGLELIQLAIK